MKKTVLILLLSVSFLSLNLHAQSGRKTTEPKPTKDQTSKTGDEDDGITNTTVSPEGETALHALADTTGGRFYSGDSLFGIAQAFTWIAEELGRQYSIGYYPSTAGKEGERRQIKVRTTEADLVVKARDSYIYSAKGNKFTQITGNRIVPASANFRD